MASPLLYEHKTLDDGIPHNVLSTNGSVTQWPANHSTSAPMPPIVISVPPCQWILFQDIGTSRVRIWDLMILSPNVLFLLFIIWNLKVNVAKLRNTNSPIFTAFFILVLLVAIVSVLRCIVAMTVNASIEAGDIVDKVLWLVVRFFLLGTELSVIVFGVAFGHLDSKTSIQRVLIVTTTFAFLYSFTQGTLEFISPDPKFHVEKTVKNYDIFAHGGMIFWISSSAFFFLVYSTIYILPWTGLRDRLNLPSKKSFYYYALFLAILNCAQTVGSSLLYVGIIKGMCVVDVTTYIYFAGFHPLVYCTFLREFFKTAQPSILFSYKFQVDEGPVEDTVTLPYQGDDKDIANADNVSDSGSFDSTHFDRYGISNSLNGDICTNRSVNNNYYYRNPVV